jgi:hypothetical protein
LPEALKLSEIQTLEDVFQFRKPMKHKSDAHKTKLGRSVKRTGGGLGRLLVYWAGDAWVCIDGHHRLAAYQQYGLAVVPVEVFPGTLQEAVKQALLRNTEDKLPVEDRERTAAAWAIVTTWNDAFTKAELAAHAGVSTSLVGKMRGVFHQLLEEKPGVDLSDISWKQAMDLSKGNDSPDRGSLDEWQDAEVAKIRDALINTFGGHLSKHPDLLVLALKQYDEDLPGAVRDAIQALEAEEARGESELEPGEVPFPAPKEIQEDF